MRNRYVTLIGFIPVFCSCLPDLALPWVVGWLTLGLARGIILMVCLHNRLSRKRSGRAMVRGRFKGGVHPGDFKELTASRSIRTVEPPESVVIPLSQHIGAPCAPLVKKGDRVLVGQCIGDSDARLTAPVHSSVSGTVNGIVSIEAPGGRQVQAVSVTNDGLYELLPDLEPEGDPLELEPAEIIKRIRDAGIVGMGGAAFPTYFKLNVPANKRIETLIINGVECEPYLTADHRLMLEFQDEIVQGIGVAMRALQVQRAFIGIEDNKPDAISALTDRLARVAGVDVVPLKVKYPQGAEKPLIKAVTGREVPPGGLPLDVGVVVINIGTAVAIADALYRGMPLIRRVVTITGPIVKDPGNILARVGTPVSHLVEACGGLTSPLGKVIIGGPMMGIGHYTLDTPVTKGMSGVLVYSQAQAKMLEPTVCVRCAKCVQACPMGLVPCTLAELVDAGQYDLAEKHHILDCIECGCCAYICPANRRLVQTIRQGKTEVMRRKNRSA
jgi:electron transport complex protein RnfC